MPDLPAISGRSPDAVAWIALLKHRGKAVSAVFQNSHRSCAGPVQRDAIHSSTAVVVKGECQICRRSQIVVPDAVGWIALLIHRGKLPPLFSRIQIVPVAGR